MRRLLLCLVVASLSVLVLPGPAGAGINGLMVDLANPSEPLTFELQITGFDCDPGTFEVTEVLDGNDDPVTPISVTEAPGDPNSATMVLPSDTVPGGLLVVAQCADGQVQTEQEGGVEWAALAVTKVVEGAPPPDAAFVVNADCVGSDIVMSAGDFAAAEVPEDFAVDLTYGATGGVGYVYTDHPVECALTETENAGAASVTIDPETVLIESPTAFEATVTNTFVAPAPPPPPPPAPEPLVLQPRFTG